MYFTYVLQSLTTGRFYVGHCDHLIDRFHEHARGASRATRNRGSWWMPYYELHPTRGAAMKREYAIKRLKSAVAIRRLIEHQSPGVIGVASRG